MVLRGFACTSAEPGPLQGDSRSEGLKMRARACDTEMAEADAWEAIHSSTGIPPSQQRDLAIGLRGLRFVFQIA